MILEASSIANASLLKPCGCRSSCIAVRTRTHEDHRYGRYTFADIHSFVLQPAKPDHHDLQLQHLHTAAGWGSGWDSGDAVAANDELRVRMKAWRRRFLRFRLP
eukprot:GHVU01019346.1.p2 GENE.GHVU01019346.1~~GHVU01019346.1.p2  ORF type:complete len:104 (-),score=10.90 GHVU01019346.1:688-999(-)